MKATESVKKAMRLYYRRNKEKFIERANIWRKNNPDKVKESARKLRLKNIYKLREDARIKISNRMVEIFSYFGNKCSRCGFQEIAAFQIHHRFGKDGKRDWVRKSYDLNNIELLCANCHCIIHYKDKKYGSSSEVSCVS